MPPDHDATARLLGGSVIETVKIETAGETMIMTINDDETVIGTTTGTKILAGGEMMAGATKGWLLAEIETVNLEKKVARRVMMTVDGMLSNLTVAANEHQLASASGNVALTTRLRKM
jgi:hypothetical protein